MSSNSYLPDDEAGLRLFAMNFIDAANQYMTDLPITTAELTALVTLKTNFENGITNVTEAKASTKSVVASKNMAEKALIADIRTLVGKIQGSPTVTRDIKIALGLNPHDSKPTHSAPITPTALTATGFSNGVNKLKWKRTGNKAATQFVVEARYNNTGDWAIVGTETSVKFTHVGVTPGDAISYRVSAKRSGVFSPPSDSVGLYGGASGPAVVQKPALKLAA